MLAFAEKPKEYKNEKAIDLGSERMLKVCIYAAAIAAAALLASIGNLHVPITVFFDVDGALWLLLRFVIVFACIALYYLLHELIHSYISKKLSGTKTEIVREKVYAYSVSNSYFSLKAYLIYSFAPIAIIGVILLLLTLILPDKLFWQVYIIQIINLAGAAGDVYAAFKLLREKQDIVIKDNGKTVSYWTK